MTKLFRFCVINCLVATAALSTWGQAVIEGTVTLPKAAVPATSPSRYQNKTPGEVAPAAPNVAVVYLEGNFPAATTNATIAAKVVQEHFRFLPSVLPVRTGTAVEFPNLDDAYHNVFSYSKPKSFDLGRYRKEEKPAAVVFDKPGVVKLYCEIHEHMRATVLVVDTPHFTRTETNGTFRLADLPAGKYTLKAWVDDKTELKREVELKAGETLRVDLTGQ